MRDVRHSMLHRRFADCFVAEQLAGLFIDDVQEFAATDYLLRFVRGNMAILNNQVDPALCK